MYNQANNYFDTALSDPLQVVLRGLLLLCVMLLFSYSLYRILLRTHAVQERFLITGAGSIILFFVSILFFQLLTFGRFMNISVLIAIALGILFSTHWILLTSIHIMPMTSYQNTKKVLFAFSFLQIILLLSNPWHGFISTEECIIHYSSLNWGGWFMLFYCISMLIMGNFLFFTSSRFSRSLSIQVAMVLTNLIYILYLSISIVTMNPNTFSIYLFVSACYGLILLELNSRYSFNEFSFYGLPLFDQVSLMVAILDQEGNIVHQSHGARENLHIFAQIPFHLVKTNIGQFHPLYLDDGSVYQWQSNVIHDGYLINCKNISDLAAKYRERDQRMSEIIKKKSILSKQGMMDTELTKIQFHLDHMNRLENYTKKGLQEIIALLDSLDETHVTEDQVILMNLLCRFVKRRSLLAVRYHDSHVFQQEDSELLFRELLDLVVPQHYQINMVEDACFTLCELLDVQELLLALCKILMNYNPWIFVAIKRLLGVMEVNFIISEDEDIDSLYQDLASLERTTVILKREEETLTLRLQRKEAHHDLL